MFKKPIKIDFPKEEYSSLIGRDIIITHRVSDEFHKFRQGLFFKTAFGDIYKCIYVEEINNIKDSPYYDELTPSQIRELSCYENIKVVYLRLNQKRHISNNKIKEIYNTVISDYFKYLNICLSDIKLEISEVPCYNNGEPSPLYIGRSAGTFVEARKSVIINPYPEIALKYYNAFPQFWNNKYNVSQFVYSICAHELAHAVDVLNKVSRSEIENQIRDAKRKGFTTSYLETFGDDVPDSEIYAEFISSILMNIHNVSCRKYQNNTIQEISELKHKR